MPNDSEIQQLIIYVGTQAKIDAARQAGTITDDDFAVVTDAPNFQLELTSANAGDGISIENASGFVTISNTRNSAEWGNIIGTLSNQTDLQQALNGKQAVIVDLDDIRSGAALGSTSLQPSDIVDNTSSTATNKTLSANMGKSLQDQVDNLKARGRFLALWNCATGLAQTNPPDNTYEYKAGDYFIIGTVAGSGGTNYKPTGSSYTIGVASTVVETADVAVNDVYYYDGTSWALQINTQKEVAFVNIAGDPYDNTSLASALNSKQDELTVGAGIDITNDTISNSGVRSVSTGSTNGTISVNINGTSADVAVAGLGSAAFTNSTDYVKAGTAILNGYAINDFATNCITEIPQDIKLELNNGTLTVKSGSIGYYPNGSQHQMTNDITATGSGIGTKKCMVAVRNGGVELLVKPVENCVSGAGATTVDGFAYNTTTNVIAYYNESGTILFSTMLPIAICSVENNVITSIDQVFNGFGFIGSAIFALPGVKGLIPDGRNTDGTLKTLNATSSAVNITSYTGTGSRYVLMNSVGGMGSIFDFYPGVGYYDPDTNYIIRGSGAIFSGHCIVGVINYTNGKIDSFDINPISGLTANVVNTAIGYTPLSDVQVNGTSVTSGSVANIPVATSADITTKTNTNKPLTASNVDDIVKVGITTNTNTLTSSEQATACSWLGSSQQTVFRDWD